MLLDFFSCRFPIQDSVAFYVTFIAYVCIDVSVSLVLCVLLSIQILRSDVQDPRIKRSEILGEMAVVVLLGATWLLGLCAARFGGLGLEVAFCVLNSSTGICAFAVCCLFSEDARASWIRCCLFGLKLSRFREHRMTTTTAPEVFAVNPIVKTNNTWVSSAANDFLHGTTDTRKKDAFKYGRSDVIFSDVTYAKRSRSDDNRQRDDNTFNSSVLNSGAPLGEKLTYI